MAEFVCDGFIEVTLAWRAAANYGDQPVMLEQGTPVDAPCGQTIATDDDLVSIQPHGVANWDCPRCSKTNVRELSADDLG